MSKIATHLLKMHSLFSVLLFASVLIYGIYLLFDFSKALVLPAIPAAILAVAVACFGGFYLTGIWKDSAEQESDEPKTTHSRSSKFYYILGMWTIVGVIVSIAFTGVSLYNYVGSDHAVYQKVLFASATVNVLIMTAISIRKMVLSK